MSMPKTLWDRLEEQGYRVIEHIASRPDGRGDDASVLDVLIVGAGASGLNAGLQAQERGLSYVILEKGKVANTIENFPEGKYVYAEPDTVPPKGLTTWVSVDSHQGQATSDTKSILIIGSP